MKKINKTQMDKKEKGLVNKKSLLRTFSTSIFKLNLALALFFFMIIPIATAEDVIVKSGNLNVSQDLLVDTNSLFVDSTNNRVGIGTSTPSVGLNINGANNMLVLNSKATGEGNDKHAGMEFRMTDVNAVAYIDFAHGAENLTSPDYRARILVYGNQSSASDNYSMLFYTKAYLGGGEVMRLTGDGKVGIGTASPGKDLEVAGTIKYSALTPLHYSTGNNVYFYKLGNLNGYGSRLYLKIVGQNGYATQKSLVTIGTVSIGNADNEFGAWQYTIGDSDLPPTIIWKDPGGTDNIDVYVRLGTYFRGSVEVVDSYGFTLDATPQTPVADPSGLNATENFLIQSNVGIGTSTPTMELDVNGDVTADDFITKSLAYNGDALTELKNIKRKDAGTGFGEIDHNSAGELAVIFDYKADITDINGTVIGEETKTFEGISMDRSLAMLIRANQQLVGRVEQLEADIAALKG